MASKITRIASVLLIAALSSCDRSPTTPATIGSASSAPLAAPTPPPLPGEAPDVWANRVSAAYDTRQPIVKVLARPPKEVAVAMIALRLALEQNPDKAVRDSGHASDVTYVVDRLDAIWKHDKLDDSTLSPIRSRIPNVSASELSRWNKALAEVQQGSVSKLWTIVLLARTDALFPGSTGALDLDVSERLMQRVKNVPASAVADLSTSLQAAKVDVALRIAENARFFDETSTVRQPELDQAVAAVKSLRPGSPTGK